MLILNLIQFGGGPNPEGILVKNLEYTWVKI